MIDRIILYFSILVLALCNTSFRWPLESGRITSTFCESRWDHFHDGVDMVSDSDKVFPVSEGKLLFFWDKSLFPLDSYPGGGNYKLLKHRDNIYSLYMHLADGVSSKENYTENDPIGVYGNTGRSFSRHLHFTLINIRKGISVNPFRMLPPFSDTSGPEFGDMALRIGDKIVILRDDADIRLTRHYPLLIGIRDTISGREKLGIYRLKVVFNGLNALDINFKALASFQNGLTVSKKKYSSLFDEEGYYKIEGVTYREGINTVQCVSADYYGNETVKNYTLNVKLDMPEK